jgi:tetratricopeptide (TPR) repeat protein
VLLLLPIFLLGLLEACLRLGGYGYNPRLFRSLKIGAEDCFVQNEDFSRRFFPREIARHPGPIKFPARKAPGTFRIFVLGESAAMGDPAESFAPDRYLTILLQEKYPGIRFEIINVAFTAINSHVILPIARECADYKGDLWIIYMGNNEMVGPFGAATVFGWQAPPMSLARLSLAFQRLRIGQLIVDLGRKFGHRSAPAVAWSGMGMFLEHPVAPDSRSKEVVYRNFQMNLDDIVRAGVHSGARVLLNTVAVNLKDCPPFASATNSALPATCQAQFEFYYTNGLRSAAHQEWANATAQFEQAGKLVAGSAELQFQWGQALLAQSNWTAAQEHLQLACDNDALPFRADARINAAIMSEREKFTGRGLVVLDSAAALAAGNVSGVCGQEIFYEHVHFDFAGRYRLGRVWAEQIESLLPPNTNAWINQDVCEQKLGLSAWNRAQVIHLMDERLQMPPLSGQANNAGRRAAMAARIHELGAQMNADHAARTRQSFQQLLAQRPEDFFLRQEYAIFLELTHDASAAATEWQRYRDLLPHDSLGYYEAGRMLNAQQKYAEAETLLRTSAALRPSRTDTWFELGNALAVQARYAEAIDCYSTALQQDPCNPQLLFRRGKLFAFLNRHAEAIENYRAAIRLNPAEGLFHHELAVQLVAERENEAAGNEFREAARLNPESAAARFDYGGWLMDQKQWDAAQQEFEAVMRLDPGNLQARQNLAWLQGKRRQGP